MMHEIYTGITSALAADEDKFHVCMFHESTEVYFGEMEDEVIKAYITTGEPMQVLFI